MLKLFKSTTALIPFLFILTLLLGLRLSVLYNGYIENNWLGNLAPLSLALKNNFGNLLLTNSYFNLILSAFLVFFQSTVVISLLSFFKVEALKGFLVAWLYVLIMHLFPSYVFLSPELLSLTFVLLAFRTTVLVDESRKKLKNIFTTGLFLGLATALYLPSSFFILVSFVALFRNSTASFREILLLLIGFFVPFFYTAAYLYIAGTPASVLSGFEFNQFQFNFYNPNQLLSFYLLLLIILLSINLVMSFLNKLLMHEKLFFQLVFFYVLAFGFMFFFQNENNVNFLLAIIFPTALFLSIYFNRIKRIFVAESLHLILFLTIIVNFIYFLK